MDFDLSKENIQPLRGGRNVAQLGVALQAPHNQECQQELIQQRQEFENAIHTYVGDDPLEIYYHYIMWVEQSYPKQGNEGNLAPLLEDCLSKFENDERYKNDGRFCKLWIKYIDMQQNPIELYQMLHSRGICAGCTDLYKAWAFYHEAASDFRNANIVFQTGKKHLAQPYEELILAHENMIFAAGQQSIYGVDERRLVEQRTALTTLLTLRPGRVGSVRTASSNTPGTLPAPVNHRSNVAVPVYSDNEEVVLGAGAPPVSVLSAVKRDAVKENFTKAGTWTAGFSKKTSSHHAHKTPGFEVHDESNVSPEIRGIILNPKFSAETYENFSHWKSDICIPDPDDPTKIPMYCKKQVYIDPTTEYSIEEVLARRYLRSCRSRLNVPPMETEQAIQSIIECDDMDHSMQEVQEVVFSDHQLLEQQHVSLAIAKDLPHLDPNLHVSLDNNVDPLILISDPSTSNLSNKVQDNLFQQPLPQLQNQEVAHLQYQASPCNLLNHTPKTFAELPLPSSSPQMLNPSEVNAVQFLASPSTSSGKKIWPQNDARASILEQNWNFCWNSPNEQQVAVPVFPKQATAKFAVFEESNAVFKQEAVRIQPKGSAMKTPFKEINDEDLAETGSRGGMETAAVAQPADGAKPPTNIDNDDDSTSWFAIAPGTPNTELFRLDAVHVSTPHNKEPHFVEVKSTKKQLFPNNEKALSMITEEKSCSSSNSGTSSTQRSMYHLKLTNMDAIEEESTYRSNLTQNMKANAALREQLLNSFGGNMECDAQAPTMPVISDPRTIEVVEILDDESEDDAEELIIKEHVPYPVLQSAPSDPFKTSVIEKLLQHVGFPGRHQQGYTVVGAVTRLQVKKEPIYIGTDRFIIEKLLGKGTFGSVYKGLRVLTGEAVALKYQKPPNKWEYYICREIQSRLVQNPIRHKFMNVPIGYFNSMSSILLSEFSPYGSLLDVANLTRTKCRRPFTEQLVLFFTLEMLTIVQAMHEIKLIHADIKPDNFLVMIDGNNSLSLQLIDFGCSIDMSLYPEGTMFTRRVTTEDFVCCEMIEGKPWSYHTDIFCVAATTHVLLFEKYIDVKKKDNVWAISQKFQRYWCVDLWNMFFSSMLNMEEGLPNIEDLKQFMKGYVQDGREADVRELINIVKNR